MTTTRVPEDSICGTGRANLSLAVSIAPEGNKSVVHLDGELDLATSDRLHHACTAGNHPSMVLDVTRLTFMDCCGYGSIIESSNKVRADGRTLTIRGYTGQPARLIELIRNAQSV